MAWPALAEHGVAACGVALDGVVLDVPNTAVNNEAFGHGGTATIQRSLSWGPPRRGDQMRAYAIVDAVLGRWPPASRPSPRS